MPPIALREEAWENRGTLDDLLDNGGINFNLRYVVVHGIYT